MLGNRALVPWGAAILAAVLAGGCVHHWLRPSPESSHVALVTVDVPAGWRDLPVVARGTGEVQEKNEHGVDHRRQLGAFSVTWLDPYYKDTGMIIAAPYFTIAAPDLPGSLHGGLPCTTPPDELRRDEAAGVWVLVRAWDTQPCGAFHRGKVVDTPAYDPSPGTRIRVSLLAACSVLLLAFAIRVLRWATSG